MKNKLKKSLLLIFIIFILSIVNSTKAQASTINNITFDSRFYAEQNGDLMSAFGYNDGALYNHYANFGINEGRMASLFFDVNFYKSTYSDLRQAFGNNNRAYYDHFVNYGMNEGRASSIFLDVNFYKSRNGDLQQAFGNNNKAYYEHFVNYGINEGRAGSVNFDVKAYLANYGDLQKAFGTNYREAMKHYIKFGKNEGRQAVATSNNGGNGNNNPIDTNLKNEEEKLNFKLAELQTIYYELKYVDNITNEIMDSIYNQLTKEIPGQFEKLKTIHNSAEFSSQLTNIKNALSEVEKQLETFKKLSQTKRVGNYEISNIKVSYNNGMSTILADVKNIGTTKTDLQFIKITLFDKYGNTINKLSGIIETLEPGETTKLRVATTADLSITYDIKFEYETEKQYMNGYEVMGNIEIPKTNVNLPVLEKTTKKSLETSVAILYGVGLNQAGNTTIVGHNYRNGTFFSDNKNLSKGDIIYITDQTGVKITYQIYDIFETDPSDAEYMKRDTKGAREISLSTTSDDSSSSRLVILAKEV